METNMKKYIKLIMEADMSPMAAVPVQPQQAPPQEPPVDTSNPEDVIKLDVPLLIRLLEYAREDANTDMDLHKLAERMTSLCSGDRSLGMAEYDQLVAADAPPEETPDAPNNMAAGMEEPAMAEGYHTNTIGAIADQAYVPKVGDKIHAGLKTKGGAGFEGTVYKVDDTHAYFKNDEGRTFKALFAGISPMDNEEEDEGEYIYDKAGNYVGPSGMFDAGGHYNAEKGAERADFIDENEYDDEDDRTPRDEEGFQDGDQVRLKPEYAEGDEIFTVTQCNPDRQKCWIADADGRGWGVRFDQIEMAEDGDEGDDMEPNDDEESANYHRMNEADPAVEKHNTANMMKRMNRLSSKEFTSADKDYIGDHPGHKKDRYGYLRDVNTKKTPTGYKPK